MSTEHDPSPLPWRLMVLALAGDFVPPEPRCPGPVLRCCRRPLSDAVLLDTLPFAVRWHEQPHVLGRHFARWADR